MWYGIVNLNHHNDNYQVFAATTGRFFTSSGRSLMRTSSQARLKRRWRRRWWWWGWHWSSWNISIRGVHKCWALQQWGERGSHCRFYGRTCSTELHWVFCHYHLSMSSWSLSLQCHHWSGQDNCSTTTSMTATGTLMSTTLGFVLNLKEQEKRRFFGSNEVIVIWKKKCNKFTVFYQYLL